MTRIGLIAALALLTAALVYAQGQQFDPVVPRVVPESRSEPAGELGSTTAPVLVMDPRRGHSDADARHCLELATDREVHRCAEKYRSRASRAASAAKAEKPAPAAKTTAVVKPPVAAAKPDDVAKAADLVKPMDLTKIGGTPKAAAPDTAKSVPMTKPAETPKPAK